MSKASPFDFANSAIFNYKNRYNLYSRSNLQEIQYEISRIGSEIGKKLGFYAIELDTPLVNVLQQKINKNIHLGIVVKFIVFTLFLVSIFILYNLLTLTLEKRIFEFAILRSLGINRRGLVALILMQTFIYIIPAIIFGYLVSLVVLQILEHIFLS